MSELKRSFTQKEKETTMHCRGEFLRRSQNTHRTLERWGKRVLVKLKQRRKFKKLRLQLITPQRHKIPRKTLSHVMVKQKLCHYFIQRERKWKRKEDKERSEKDCLGVSNNYQQGTINTLYFSLPLLSHFLGKNPNSLSFSFTGKLVSDIDVHQI